VMPGNLSVRTRPMLLAELLVSSIFLSCAFAQPVPNQDRFGQTAGGTLVLAAWGRHGHPAIVGTPQTRREALYKQTWGIDQIDVHTIASGSMLEFRYRVLDPERAKLLNDEKTEPYLIDEATGIKLKVAETERIGKLRTIPPPQAGRIYWIIFGDSTHVIKRGSHVSVVIGGFRINDLVVD
jgi:hypothetical protein